MPIPNRIRALGWSEDDEFFYNRATWELVFTLWPRSCSQSGKHIWLEWCYKGTVMITGPGDPVFLYRWIRSNEYLLAQIKGLIT